MAIYHFSVKPIGRNAGKSAVAAIAYRTASRILNERECITHDFTAKKGVVHAEIVLPDGLDAPWARDRALLWNAAEFAERRCDARVGREFEIALPHELSDAGRLALTRAFATDLSNRFGAAVDFAIHVPQGKSDERNIHAHVVMTTRAIAADGLGEKTLIERENRWLIDRGLPTTQMQVKQIREASMAPSQKISGPCLQSAPVTQYWFIRSPNILAPLDGGLASSQHTRKTVSTNA